MTNAITRRERKKREATNRIVESAAALFAARGYGATTMDDIGERADVSRATVFNYFARKEDIVLAWFTDRRAEFARLLAESDGQGDTSGRLRAAFGALAHIFERSPEIGRGMVRAWLQAGGPLLTPESDTSRLFAAVIRDGQDAGDIAGEIDPDRTGYILFDAYVGELNRWATAEGKPRDLERPLLAMLEIILSGIATRR
jgi:AcrR family transcriptional regulator